jgi:DNA-binding IscR family transcriptional regulator
MILKKTAKAVDIAVFITSRSAVEPVTTEEIASGLGLSSSYTESILKELREAGLIREDITLWDVVKHFEVLHSFDELYADDAHPMKSLEADIQRHLQEALASQTLDDVAIPFMPRDARVSSMLGQFRLKPLPAPVMPRAPNSVFQLSMMF